MKFTKKILPNGLRVLSVPDAEALAATVLVLVEAGSKYETKEINGVSHFLEHMCFKGTTKRPKALLISSELDSLGAQYNAFTSQEYTGYYAKVQSKHFDKALDIVADLYLNPLFDAAEIEKEKGVIIEEINMYEDMPNRKVGELLMKLMYGDQPAGWGVAGEKEIIKVLKREDFIDYRKRHYVAKATTVVLAGKYNEKNIFQKTERMFAAIEPNSKKPKIKTKEKQSAPQSLVHFKETDQTHLVIGFRSKDLFHPDVYALEVLAAVLGGGMSSRLFQVVREEMGAAYYVRAGNDSYTDHGIFEIAAGVDNKKIKPVIAAILKEVNRLKEELVGESELRKVKDSLMGHLYLGLEKSDEIANFFGGQEILKKEINTPSEIAKKVEAVKSIDLKKISREIFKDKRLNMAVIGPFKEPNLFAETLHL